MIEAAFEDFCRHLKRLTNPSSHLFCVIFAQFFESFFEYMRLRNLNKLTQFSDDEKQVFEEHLNPAIVILSKQFDNLVTYFGRDTFYDILRTRSALQFIVTDLSDFTTPESRALLDKMISDEEYNEFIEDFCSPWWNFRFLEEDVPDLNGIPPTHTWWTADNRQGKENPRNKETFLL